MGSRDRNDRRTFLKRAGAYTGLLGVGSVLKYDTQLFLLRKAPAHDGPPLGAWEGATVKEYRPLGRTGWKMSDISFGSSNLTDPNVLRLALDRGVNYVGRASGRGRPAVGA